jgi:hypothetical protein
MSPVVCPDCRQEMELGYVPDRGDSSRILQLLWQSSTPQPAKIFGLETGSVKPSDGKPPLPDWAFRCRNCGLLRLHALPTPAEETT